jgi:hypothetical protein
MRLLAQTWTLLTRYDWMLAAFVALVLLVAADVVIKGTCADVIWDLVDYPSVCIIWPSSWHGHRVVSYPEIFLIATRYCV